MQFKIINTFCRVYGIPQFGCLQGWAPPSSCRRGTVGRRKQEVTSCFDGSVQNTERQAGENHVQSHRVRCLVVRLLQRLGCCSWQLSSEQLGVMNMRAHSTPPPHIHIIWTFTRKSTVSFISIIFSFNFRTVRSNSERDDLRKEEKVD